MGGQEKTPNWGNTENGVVGNGKRYAEQVLWFPLLQAHNNEVAAAPLLRFCAVKGSKDPRAVPRKDHEKGLTGLQTVFVPFTDGQSPGVSGEKEEMRFLAICSSQSRAGYSSQQSLENPSWVAEG